MQAKDYSSLFKPGKIGNVVIKNRIGIAPMGLFSTNTDGSPSPQTAAFYEERARGGAGLIIVGASMVSEKAANGITAMYWDNKAVIPHHTELVERVHRYGAKAAIAIGIGSGRNAVPAMLDGREPVSASAVPYKWDPSVLCRPLSLEEIKELVNGYEVAAFRAKCAGYDIIEVHAHCGYLIDQFLSPLWNKREDEYGGSDENRARFAIEILQAIRRGAGKDIPIVYRIAPDHRIPGSRNLENCGPLFSILENAGADAFDVDAGSYEQLDYIFPTAYLGDACLAYVCPTVRKHTNLPILNAGNHTPETGVELIESGNGDFVLFGRPLIADPELPKKLMEGRAEDIRPCLRCNEECVRRCFERTTKVSCAVNPAANQEEFYKITKAEKPIKVVVAGGGPGGMEAARVAALQGHSVDLYEAGNFLGGNARVASTPLFKNRLKALIDWYELQLKKLGVRVHLNSPISADDAVLADADHIVMAVGAHEATPPIPGIDGSNVISVTKAHMEKDAVGGQQVVVCGGGLSGCDSALELAQEHAKDVTVVEMLPDMATGNFVVNQISLMNALNAANVKLRNNCRVKSIDEQGVLIINEQGAEELLPAQTVITAFGLRKNDALADAVRDKYPTKTWVIGDCEKIGNVASAIRGGYYASMSLID